jgi:hypothetical protein
MGECSSRAHKKTLVGIILGPSGGCGRSSAKQKVARILSDNSRAISPRMRHLFIDRQYSPSTSTDQSEWEMILGELICMRFLLKHTPVSEGDD